MRTRRRQRPPGEQRGDAEADTLAPEARVALATFARFQASFAAAAADHAAGSPLEVRLQLAETAVDIARAGESLNLLASLLDLPERVPTISPEAAEAVVRVGRAVRSERA